MDFLGPLFILKIVNYTFQNKWTGMKKAILILLLTAASPGVWAQLNSYSASSFTNTGNPGGLNTEADFDNTGWTLAMAGSQMTNQWSSVINLPFYFEFYGQPVTACKVSANGVLTFDTGASTVPGDNVSIPTASLPNQSVACYWDRFTAFPPTGSNDQVLTKTFGSAPNRQFWVRWSSFEWNSISFAFVGIVLEESSHKIYLVDMYSSFPSTSVSSTSGVQQNSTIGVQQGTTTVALAGNGSAHTDNSYIQMTPVLVQPFDVSPVAILSPANTDCGMGVENVTIQITNNGLNAASGVLARFSVDGGPFTSAETIPSSIPVGGLVNYTFTQKANLAAQGLHTIRVALYVAGDGDNTDDSLQKDVVHVGTASGFPYVEDFEGGSGGWVAQGVNSSWQLGTPAGAIIQSAGSGTKSWVTNLTGAHNASEKSQVYSPCFNFTNAPAGVAVTLRLWWETEPSWDGAVLQYSTNGGTTWTNLGGFQSITNWYNNVNIVAQPGNQAIGWSGRSSTGSGGWVTLTHPLPQSLIGQPEVRFRFAFASDAFNNFDGVAFDRFMLSEAPVVNLGTNGIKCNGTVLNAANPGATYLWSTGATSQTITLNNNTGNWITDSTITVQVTNSIGVIARDTIVFSMAPTLTVTVDSTRNIVCGGTSTGGVFISLNGGVSPYSYQWTNGSSNQDLTNVGIGTYSATVTDAAGCTAAVPARTLTQNPVINVALDSVRTVNCHGSATGRIYITPSGGVGAFTYSWNSGQTAQDLINIPAGNYTVTVRDALQCPRNLNVTVTQNDSIAISLASIVKVSCATAQDGAININVAGGVGPYTYLWSNGATVKNPSGLSVGSHAVFVTDSKGCVRQQTFTIGQEVVMQVGLLNMLPSACEQAATGELSIQVSGGTTPYTYSWTGGQTTANPVNLSPGFHTVTITDGRGCTAVDSFAVGTSTDTIVAALVQMNPAACPAITDGSLTISVNGGNAPYTFSWSNGSTVQNPQALTSGVYAVTIRDVLGCLNDYAFEVTARDTLAISAIAIQDASCVTASDGSVALTVSGGASPYTYSWSNGSTLPDPADLPSGENTVLVRDNAGCEGVASFTIGSPAPPEVIVDQITPVFCADDEEGSISVTISGGVAPYTYSWSNGQPFEDIIEVKGGWHVLAITQANGCRTLSDSIFVPYTDSIPVASFVMEENGLEATFVSTSERAQSWMWDFGDGNNAIGDSVTHVYQTKGEYTVVLSVSNTCGVSQFSDTLGVYPTGLPQITDATFSLYPNPNQGEVFLNLGGYAGEVQLSLTDQLGREVWRSQKQATGDPLQVAWNDRIAEGVYSLRVFMRDGWAHFRVVME
jgi:hypothetical protein